MDVLSLVRKFYPGVNHVEDAKKSITIEVTNRDNKAATVKNHKSCAMAVACKRKLHADGVIISMSRAYVIKGDRALRYDVPGSVAREIVSFDRNGEFEPGEYALNRPGVGHQLGYGGSGPHKRKGKKPGKFNHITGKVRISLNSKMAA